MRREAPAYPPAGCDAVTLKGEGRRRVGQGDDVAPLVSEYECEPPSRWLARVRRRGRRVRWGGVSPLPDVPYITLPKALNARHGAAVKNVFPVREVAAATGGGSSRCRSPRRALRA